MLLLIITDQISKYIVVRYFLLPVYYNPNVAFSLQIPWWLGLLFVCVVFLYYALKHGSRIKTLLLSNSLIFYSTALFFSGAFSNLIDRAINNGSVVDFIDLKFFPVFNLADSFIVAGVTLFIYYSVVYKRTSVHNEE